MNKQQLSRMIVDEEGQIIGSWHPRWLGDWAWDVTGQVGRMRGTSRTEAEAEQRARAAAASLASPRTVRDV